MTLVKGDYLLTYRQDSLWTNKYGAEKIGGDLTLIWDMHIEIDNRSRI